MYCRHVYEYVNAEICPDCGRDTHETDWQQHAELHRQWLREGRADWSICPVEGGTLRGWWSI